jgi:hypothetical protein
MDNELEKMCKDAIVAHFEVLYQQLPGGTDRKHEKSVRIACF